MKKGLVLGIILIVAGLLLFQNSRGKIGTPIISNANNLATGAGAITGLGAVIIFATYYNS